MAQSYLLKNLQPSMRGFIRPMLLISLALHAIVFFVPTSLDQDEPEPAPPEEETVSLTQLPPVNQPAPQPSPATPPLPRPSVAPRRALTPTRSNVPQTVRRNAPSLTQRPQPRQQGSPAAAPVRPPADAFVGEFPVYPGATPGSWSLPSDFDAASRKTVDAIAAVMDFYERGLVARGYTPTLVEQGSGRTVYQVSKQGVTQYLHLFPNPTDAGTSIVLNSQVLPADLSSVQVEDVGVATFFSDLPVPSVDPNSDRWQRVSEPQQLLSQPNAFFSDLGSEDGGFVIEPKLRAEIRTAVVGIGQTPQDVFADISQKLEVASYSISALGSYGGGELYEITREETNNQGQPTQVTGYLNLVPSADGGDTVIFVWQQRPSS